VLGDLSRKTGTSCDKTLISAVFRAVRSPRETSERERGAPRPRVRGRKGLRCISQGACSSHEIRSGIRDVDGGLGRFFFKMAPPRKVGLHGNEFSENEISRTARAEAWTSPPGRDSWWMVSGPDG